MPWTPDAPGDDEADDDLLVVAVVRTGGIAGLRRQWQIEKPAPQAHDWFSLIDRCPWNAPEKKDPGADRYRWSIRVRTAQEQRERELADSEVEEGAWRDLVDAVREADSSGRTPTPDGPASRG